LIDSIPVFPIEEFCVVDIVLNYLLFYNFWDWWVVCKVFWFYWTVFPP